MPYTVKHDPILDIVEVTFIGSITSIDLREATSKCITLQKQMGVTRFLVEANGCDVIASLFDIYYVIDKQYWHEELDRQSRIAVLLPTSVTAVEAANFYEFARQKHGWNARLQPNRQSALEWLTGTIGLSWVDIGEESFADPEKHH